MIREVSNQNSVLKILYLMAVSLVVTVFLFYFMAYLISGGKKLSKSLDSENIIEFVRIKRPAQTELRKRKLPKKPEIVEQPKATKSLKLNNESVKPNRPDMNFDTPKLDIPLALGAGGIGVAGGGGSASGDADEMPLVRVEPQFPTEAAIKGIEYGWVRVIFDLNPDGTVTNFQIVDSSHRDIFDMATKRAVLKWKYRPKMVDGKAIARKGIKVQLEFGLEK